MEKNTHTLKFSIIIIALFLFSCASRKVNVNKEKSEINIDSVSVKKKDSVSVQQNAISIKENIDEIEVVPIDTTKPIIIGDKKYYNATVRFKKTQREVIDTSKTTVSKSVEDKISIKKDIKTKTFSKKVDKKPNYFIFLWLLLIPLLAWLIKRFILK